MRRAARSIVTVALACLVPAGASCKGTDPRGEPVRREELGVPSAASASSASPPPVAPSPPPSSEPQPLTDDEVTAIVNPSHMTEYAGPTAAIEGSVRVTGDPAEVHFFHAKLPSNCTSALTAYGPDYVAGPHGELRGALVAVLGVSGFVRPRREDKQARIHDCVFQPQIIDLDVGARLLVSNDDRDVYAPQLPGRRFVERLAIKGQSPVVLMPTKPGAFAIDWIVGMLPGSDVPRALLYVLPSALHMVTAADGKFRIDGVPVGKAHLSVSYAGMPEFTKDLVLKAGEVAHVDATLHYAATKPSASASASAAPSTSAPAIPLPR
jgi:hypothetical protein